jgi:ABC-type branched-subunit amino acid transport system substrate-binding protein
MRAVAALSLSGRYAPFARQAAAGLRAWADAAGATLRIEDDRSDPVVSGCLLAGLARGADLVFGPYGSGAAREAARAMAGRPEVVWNHGGAEVPDRDARMIDVLGPARGYWRGLPEAIGAQELVRVVVARAPGGFGAAVAEGAVRALAGAGAPAPRVLELARSGPAGCASAAREAGAAWVVGGGRAEDDLALGRALASSGLRAGLVVCGVALAARELGDAVAGWIGPAQWAPGGPPPPVPLPPGSDYPAAQALAAGLLGARALELAGSAQPDALWDAARGLRATTFLGPFAVDERGRQVAHAPLIVRWRGAGATLRREVVWRPGPRGVRESTP